MKFLFRTTEYKAGLQHCWTKAGGGVVPSKELCSPEWAPGLE